MVHSILDDVTHSANTPLQTFGGSMFRRIIYLALILSWSSAGGAPCTCKLATYSAGYSSGFRHDDKSSAARLTVAPALAIRLNTAPLTLAHCSKVYARIMLAELSSEVTSSPYTLSIRSSMLAAILLSGMSIVLIIPSPTFSNIAAYCGSLDR